MSATARDIARVAYEAAPVGATITDTMPGEYFIVSPDRMSAVAVNACAPDGTWGHLFMWATLMWDDDRWSVDVADAGDEQAARAAMLAWAEGLS